MVPKDRGAALAHNQGISFLETSAKTNYNIDETFETLAKQILRKVGATHLISWKLIGRGGGKLLSTVFLITSIRDKTVFRMTFGESSILKCGYISPQGYCLCVDCRDPHYNALIQL